MVLTKKLTKGIFSDRIDMKRGDNLKERILILRKKLKLTQKQLGDSLGITNTAVSKIENGENNVTDQIVISICKIYSVNEHWLRTGEGEMFTEIDADDEYFAAATEISNDNDEFAMAAVIEYWKLDKESKKAIRNYITSLANIVKEQE